MQLPTRFVAFTLSAALLALGCANRASHATATGDPSGLGDDGGADPGSDASSIDPGNPGDQNCNEQKFTPTKVGNPDIILIQDTSGSMADGTPSKYSQVVAAVGDVIDGLDQQMVDIDWGLVVFPIDDSCGVSNTLQVPVAAHDGNAIVSAIQAKQPGGSTPTAVAVQTAASYYASKNDGRGHYLLLATDGEPNCDNGNALPAFCMSNNQCPMGQTCMLVGPLGVCIDPTGGGATKAIAAAYKAGIKTFVVGIATQQGDSATLNQMAMAGGTARGGANQNQYYDVTDQASLETAFQTITGLIISCTFQVQTLPMQNQDIVVDVGGAQVAQDKTHMNGWDFDATTKTLTFYGGACTALQKNPATVTVGYTCPPPG